MTDNIDVRGRRPSANAEDNSTLLQDKEQKKEIKLQNGSKIVDSNTDVKITGGPNLFKDIPLVHCEYDEDKNKVVETKKEIDCIVMRKGFVEECKFKACEFYDSDCNEICLNNNDRDNLFKNKEQKK